MKMEMEQSTPEVTKKLWGLVRAVLYMMRKGFCKSKIMVDLHVMLKRGKIIASKAIGELMHSHYASFTCRSHDSLSFVSPKEYEFSCSNSPAFGYLPFTNGHAKFGYKRNKHNFYHNYHRQLAKSSYRYDEAATISAVQKVLEMLNAEAAETTAPSAAPSPFVLPGFGKSPMVRQLRITDSPFPLKDEGDNGEVDVAAEEFIKKFYKDLKLQKSMVGPDSPYFGAWGR